MIEREEDCGVELRIGVEFRDEAGVEILRRPLLVASG
jgi:hypothetical protein